MHVKLTVKCGSNVYEFARDGRVTSVGDGASIGSDIYYSERLGKWVATDHDRQRIWTFERLAAVRPTDDTCGVPALDEFAIAADLERENEPVWFVPGEWLDSVAPGLLIVLFCEPAA